jgi:2-polyprenyl-3-methyl-5-hydroxy-6-metoxy-1,4-benzoquinol methylase
VFWEKINLIYHKAEFFGIQTTLTLLKDHIKNGDKILEIGPGRTHLILELFSDLDYLGLEIHKPYFEKLNSTVNSFGKKHKIIRYKNESVLNCRFTRKEFDWVVLLDVIEHLPKEQGLEILALAKDWSKKGVILSTPNGFYQQGELDGNPNQAHLSGWDLAELENLGFEVFGLAGAKILRKHFHSDEWSQDFSISMRWKPRIFWFFVATISQYFTHRAPKYSFQLFAVQYNK